MESLTEEEQEMYDIVSEIENKINLVERQLEEMIREGRLTAGEPIGHGGGVDREVERVGRGESESRGRGKKNVKNRL